VNRLASASLSTLTFPMNDILNKSTVLVLNRHWQAIHVKTPAEAFCMIATGAATALDVQGDDYITPVRWDDWLKLPVREHDNAVNTPRGPVRVPTVIVAANYAKVPLRRPRFGARGIWERDGGVCQYTGRKLAPKEGNIDHVVPRSRGGKTVWTNVVTACGSCNLLKGNRMPQQSGMFPKQKPIQPTSYMLQENGRAFPPNYLHESWRDYLYWDTELDPA